MLVVDQSASLLENNKLDEVQKLNIDSKRFSRKQRVSPDNVFPFETLHYDTQGIKKSKI